MKQTGRSMFPWNKPITDLNETHRTYVWPGGDTLTIYGPRLLVVTDNGHRLIDEEDVVYYVAYGWLYIKWTRKDETASHFYFQRHPEEE